MPTYPRFRTQETLLKEIKAREKSAYARKLFLISMEEDAGKKVEALEKYTDIDIPVISTQALMEANPKHRNKILLIDFSEHKELVLSIKIFP